MEKKSGKKKSSTKATKTIKAEKEVEVVEEVKSEKEVVKTSTENDKKTSHFLFKILAISIFVAIILSWIIPAGTFNGANLTTTEPARTGINEMFLSMFYASNYYLLQYSNYCFVCFNGHAKFSNFIVYTTYNKYC